jgi:hypothetical protein
MHLPIRVLVSESHRGLGLVGVVLGEESLGEVVEKDALWSLREGWRRLRGRSREGRIVGLISRERLRLNQTVYHTCPRIAGVEF